jgi:hypothetical protein
MSRYEQRLDAIQARLDAAEDVPSVVTVEVPYGAADEAEDALIEAALADRSLDRAGAARRGTVIVLLTDFGSA